MPSRILLLCDIKFRDLPGLAAVRVRIEERFPDSDVLILPFTYWQQAIDLFVPHVVVLNHLHGKLRNQKIADTVQRRGGLVVVLSTEGRPNTEAQLKWATQDWPANLCDLYLCWSEEFASHLPPEVNRVVTGCPRFDFYREPLKRLTWPRHHSLSRHGLDPARLVVTVASSFPQAKFSKMGRTFNLNDWKDLKQTTIPGREDPQAFADAEARRLEIFRDWIGVAVRAVPEAQFALKPHPAEDITEWKVWCDRNGVSLILSDYAWNFLSLSHIHISRWGCTTVPEAWMWGIPTITLIPDNWHDGMGENGAGEEAAHLSNVLLSSPENLPSCIRKLVDTGRIADFPEQSQLDYLEKWFTWSSGPAGNHSSGLVAKAICNLLEQKQPQTFKTPTPDDLRSLWLLSAEADMRVAQTDHIGQFDKTITQTDVRRWVDDVRRVLHDA